MIWYKKQVIDHLYKEQWDKKYKCDVYSETRSQAQNRLYWQWLWFISWWFANIGACIDENQLHEAFKEKFIKTQYKLNKLTKKRYKQEKSTTKLDKAEFSKYLKDIDWYLLQTYDMTVLKPTELNLICN